MHSATLLQAEANVRQSKALMPRQTQQSAIKAEGRPPHTPNKASLDTGNAVPAHIDAVLSDASELV